MSSTTSNNDAVRPRPAVSVVVAIRDAITDGEFAANQRLIESDLSERFGASRGNVRIALLQLTSEGLVERMQNRGARVLGVLPRSPETDRDHRGPDGPEAGSAQRRRLSGRTADDCEQLRLLGGAMKEAVASGDLLRYSDLNRQLDAHIQEAQRSAPSLPKASSSGCVRRTCATSSGWRHIPAGRRCHSLSTSRFIDCSVRLATPTPPRLPLDETCAA